MKLIYYFSILLAAALISCSTDTTEVPPLNETEGLLKIRTFDNDLHQIEVFSETSDLEQGYNNIVLRISEKGTKKAISNADISWIPIMNMGSKQHSAPKSQLIKRSETLYEGYIVFPMAENESEFWTLTFHYSIDGVDYTMADTVRVSASPRKRVLSLQGTDGISYILALVDPTRPTVASNDMIVGLFKMENMMNFSQVDNYRILIDPRMPAMDNHGTPNNVHLNQSTDGLYHGKANLSMSGYWRIYLQVENEYGKVIKGDPTESALQTGNLYLELEF